MKSSMRFQSSKKVSDSQNERPDHAIDHYEAAIFAGAYAALHGVSYFRSTKVDERFRSFPAIIRQGFVSVLQRMFDFVDESELSRTLFTSTLFYSCVENGNVRRDGFKANRLAREIILDMKALLKKSNQQILTTTLRYWR